MTNQSLDRIELALAYYVREVNYMLDSEHWWGKQGHEHGYIAIDAVHALQCLKNEKPCHSTSHWCQEIFKKNKLDVGIKGAKR